VGENDLLSEVQNKDLSTISPSIFAFFSREFVVAPEW